MKQRKGGFVHIIIIVIIVIVGISVIGNIGSSEKAVNQAKDSVQKAESDPSDSNINNAKSDINKLPEDKRAPFSERIAKLEKAKQEEKERADKAKKEAEEKKKQEEAAAAIARQQQQTRSQPAATPRQTAPSPQPAPSELNFSSCKEARAAGYSHMRRGEPGYAPHLDRDGDGIACDKHR
nr:MAG TPA: Excalibur calcium-binding domain protein [Caudoviricetes sp.]